MNSNEQPDNINENTQSTIEEQNSIPIGAQKAEEATSSKLEAITIGQLEQPKSRKTTLIMFVFIVIFIGIIFFLPQIESVIKSLSGANNDDIPSNTKINNVPNNNEKTHAFNRSSKIYIDGHVIYDFDFEPETGRASFKITNNSGSRSDINTKNWHAIYYDTNEKPLEYVLVESQTLIAKNETYHYFMEIKPENKEKIRYIKIGKLTEKDYATVELKTDENGDLYFQCKKGQNTLTYYFVNNELTKIKEDYSQNNSESEEASKNYLLFLEMYQNKYGKLQNIHTESLLFKEEENRFQFETTIVLEDNKDYKAYSTDYFKKGSTAKSINFDMESKGYDCQ